MGTHFELVSNFPLKELSANTGIVYHGMMATEHIKIIIQIAERIGFMYGGTLHSQCDNRHLLVLKACGETPFDKRR